MTWLEIKRAVDEAGVEEDEDICLIECENRSGDKTFHKIRLGKSVKLAENISESARHEASGCAV